MTTETLMMLCMSWTGKNCAVKGTHFSSQETFELFASVESSEQLASSWPPWLSSFCLFLTGLFLWAFHLNQLFIRSSPRVTIEHARSRRGRGGGPPGMGRFGNGGGGGGGGGGFRQSRNTRARYMRPTPIWFLGFFFSESLKKITCLFVQ